jgi:RluA family pseudouridine synthase
MARTIQVLYQDDQYIAFDKPPGLLVIPSPSSPKPTLTDIVNSGDARGFRLHPCHRLDRETSGVILFAKGKKHQQRMMGEFRKAAVKKRYIAFVRGRPAFPSGRISRPVSDHYEKIRRRPVSRPAVTDYRVLASGSAFSVLEVFPRTGRTHQIRIHLRDFGHPLLGERLYAFGRDFPVKFPRLALHAAELRWRHPVQRAQIVITADLPRDMQDFWERHKQEFQKGR